MPLTKAQIVETIQEWLDFSWKQSVDAVEALLEILKRTMENGEDVLVSGFGRFCVKKKKPRRGRNPVTGDGLIIDGRRVVTFHCSKVLRDKLNGDELESG